MPTYDFSDKVAFVTGAARGQGRSHAVGFARNGADVVLVDVPGDRSTAQYPLADREDLEETARLVEATGGAALPIPADVREEAAVEVAVERAVDRFGRVDHLVNNAGVWGVSAAVETSERAWDAVVDTDLKGAWLCAKHVGRHFRERAADAATDGGDDRNPTATGPTTGTIVSTGSTASLVGTYGSAHYAAAKHGLLGLTRALALELAPLGVRANCVCPTGVDTPLVSGIVESVGEAALSGVSDRAGSMNVLDGGLLPPEAVTEAVLWLASDASRYVTGTAVPVDAGMTAK